jgi:hypothetical protein
MLAEPFPQVVVVVSLVSMESGRASATWTAPGADRWDTVHQWLQGLAVVQVGAGDAK